MDGEIPRDDFKAVPEIIAYVMRPRGKMLD